MEPLNSAERNSAFLQFALLFILTVVIVNMAIFFDFYIPSAENTQLKEKSIRFDEYLAMQEKLTTKVDVAFKSIAKLDTAKNYALDEQKAAAQILELNNLTAELKDNNQKYLSTNVSKSFNSWFQDKASLKKSSEDFKKLDEMNLEISKCESEKKDLQRDLDQLRIQLSLINNQ